MSTPEASGSQRARLVGRLALAGRELSDAAVMFHTALGEKLGLSTSDWKMLSLLEQHGAVTAGELASLSGLAPNTVTGILDRLERKGWIHRERDPSDKRRVVVTLDQAAAEHSIGEYFRGLQHRLEALYERYADEDLELLVEFMNEIARRQKAATAELTREA